eukprot:jgi/Mesvir1/3205/Mv16355-RA.1
MLNSSSQAASLEGIMAIPGVGAHIMGALPIPDRVRVRCTCRTFLAAVDESFLSLTELFGEDVAGDGCTPGTTTLPWLLAKCPRLTALSMASRADREVPWSTRRFHLWTLNWPSAYRIYSDYEISAGVLPLQDVALRYQGLTYLDVAGCSDVTDAGLLALARSGSARRVLTSLDVSGCNVNGASVQAVVEACGPGLRRLSVSDCHQFRDEHLVSISRNCPLLEHVDVDQTPVTDDGITALAHGCPRLRRLAISEPVTERGISMVAQHCSELERLELLWEGDWGGVTDVSLTKIAAGCPRLTWLDAMGFYTVTDEGAAALAGRCRGLRYLNLSATNVTDDGLSAVADVCPRLEHLNVHYCDSLTDTGMARVAMGCPGLEYLNVSHCHEVTDAGIGRISGSCPRLRELAVEECPLVTDAGICRVAESCKGLEELSVSGSGVAGDRFLLALAAGVCPELRALEMAKCHINASSLWAALTSGCQKLVRLDVSSPCTDGAVAGALAGVGGFFPRLRELTARCCKLGDQDVARLIQKGGRELRVLDLSGNAMITYEIRAGCFVSTVNVT